RPPRGSGLPVANPAGLPLMPAGPARQVRPPPASTHDARPHASPRPHTERTHRRRRATTPASVRPGSVPPGRGAPGCRVAGRPVLGRQLVEHDGGGAGLSERAGRGHGPGREAGAALGAPPRPPADAAQLVGGPDVRVPP